MISTTCTRYQDNGKITDRSQLTTVLNQLLITLQVNIDEDAKAPHQAVMSALEAARDTNLSNIVFSSQSNNQAKK